MSPTIRAVAIIGAIGVVGGLVWAFRPPPPPPPDPFNQCVSNVVIADKSVDRGITLEVSQKVLALFTGGLAGAGDGPALKIGTQAADRAAFKTLTDEVSKSLIDGCGRQYGRSRGPINAEVQVWTRVGGQAVTDVDVIRIKKPGDFCRTVGGNCLLLLHDVGGGGPETFEARYQSFAGQYDVSAEAIARGAISIDIAPASFRKILIKNGSRLLEGAVVTVEDPSAGTAVRSAQCVSTNRFGRGPDVDCARGETGANGHEASFLIPANVTALPVRIEYASEGRDRTARAEGSDLVAVWSSESPPALPRCSPRTNAAVKAILNASDLSGISIAVVQVHFKVVGGVVSEVTADPEGDLATLAAKTFRHPKRIDATVAGPRGCVGNLTWRSR
jgi:hypothetical protein